MKLGAGKGGTPLGLVASVFIASSLLIFVPLIRSGESASTAVISLGICSGISSAIAFWLFVNALKIGHYGFSVALLPMSSLVPVLFSIIFWKEAMGILKWVGIIFLSISIFLIACCGDSLAAGGKPLWIKWLLFMAGAFLLNGMAQISQAAVARIPVNSYFVFLFVNYLAGGILLFLFALAKRIGVDRHTVFWGTMGALGSISGCFFTLKSLATFPEAVVFPISLGGPVIAGTLLSGIFFRERINVYGYIGVFSGMAGITILCIKSF